MVVGNDPYEQLLASVGLKVEQCSAKDIAAIQDPTVRGYATDWYQRERGFAPFDDLWGPRNLASKAEQLQRDMQTKAQYEQLRQATQAQQQHDLDKLRMYRGSFQASLADCLPPGTTLGLNPTSVASIAAIPPGDTIPWCGKPFLLPARTVMGDRLRMATAITLLAATPLWAWLGWQIFRFLAIKATR